MPQFLPIWLGNHIENPFSSAGLGEKGCPGQDGSDWLFPSCCLKSQGSCLSCCFMLSVCGGFSTVLWVQGEMVLFMRSGESEKGHKHFLFYCMFNYVENNGQMALDFVRFWCF